MLRDPAGPGTLEQEEICFAEWLNEIKLVLLAIYSVV